MKYNPLKIKNLKPVLPIIQGGMAVRVSTSKLAGTVAKYGAIGTIGASGMGLEEIREEIKLAKDIANGNGLIAVNLMVASATFLESIKVILEAKPDLLVCGAGFSKDVFALAREAGVAFAPVVSSAKAAALGVKLGADLIIVEGKEAGGHLGTDRPLKEILVEVLAVVNKQVPVVGGGGILNGQDIGEILKLGADGVQIATRFVMSKECNVHDNFKNYYLSHKKEDMRIFLSPVGYPGRAILTKLLDDVESGKTGKFPCRYQCLKTCNHRFCIIEALQNAQKGDVDNGIVFTGERFEEIKDILPVKTIINNLVKELNNC